VDVNSFIRVADSGVWIGLACKLVENRRQGADRIGGQRPLVGQLVQAFLRNAQRQLERRSGVTTRRRSGSSPSL
jgi:hypothetical protein